MCEGYHTVAAGLVLMFLQAARRAGPRDLSTNPHEHVISQDADTKQYRDSAVDPIDVSPKTVR